MSLDFNLIKNFFFHKEIKKSVLEPLTCIIRCATLNYLPIGTKISIINNKIYFLEPNILQGPIRWTQGDKREDLHNIYTPILKATQWYKKENKDILNIFILAKIGLEKLKKSYDSCSIISHSLELYINIIDLYVNTNDKCIDEFFNNKKHLNVLKDENKTGKSDNEINKSLKDLWDDKQISIINNILIQIGIEEEKDNMNDWLKALDTILLNKEKLVNKIITDNTTTLN